MAAKKAKLNSRQNLSSKKIHKFLEKMSRKKEFNPVPRKRQVNGLKAKKRNKSLEKAVSKRIHKNLTKRAHVIEINNKKNERSDIILKGASSEYGFIKTGIKYFDGLIDKGIPENGTILIKGGPETGKTTLALQILHSFLEQNKKCFYISFEEVEEKLKAYMDKFGWYANHHEEKGLLMIKHFDPFILGRTIGSLFGKEKGELFIDIGIEELFSKNFKPDIVIVDSLTALENIFPKEKFDAYCVYIKHLFNNYIGATTFLILETEDANESTGFGILENQADGIIHMYHSKGTAIRGIEILKMRGTKHREKFVPMELSEKGIIIDSNT